MVLNSTIFPRYITVIRSLRVSVEIASDCRRRGLTPPPFITWTLGIWTLVGAVVLLFTPWPILLVATEVIDARRALAEVAKRVRNPAVSRCGWVRTRSAFESLWRATHADRPLRVGDLEGWLLEPRGG